MTRRLCLSDVVVECFKIIFRIERERAQPTERVSLETSMRIALTKGLEFCDRVFPRCGQRWLLYRLFCRFIRHSPGCRERAPRAHEHRHLGTRTFWKFFHHAVEPILTFVAVATCESFCAAQVKPVGFDRALGSFRALIERVARKFPVEPF